MSVSDTAKIATILVVDDISENLALIRNLLKDKYKVRVASDGQNALRIASSDDRPDLILLDIMMPDMDGYEVCKRFKSDPVFVRADRTRLKQVLINLLSNAIKYNVKQGTVEVTCGESAPGRTRISIKDSGAGCGCVRRVRAKPSDVLQYLR